MKFVRFTGKFKDLIPNGWEFQKLYGRNYRQYSKSDNGQKYGGITCRVWQSNGGTFECDRIPGSELTANIVEIIQNGDYKPWKQHLKMFNYDYYKVWLDRESNRIIPETSAEGRKIWEIRNFIDVLDDKEENKQRCNAYYKRYEEFIFTDDFIVMIQDLLTKGWIKVENNN